jgi:MYXO-CTERM domain-containing protein
MVSATADGRFQLVPLELPCDGIQALRLPTYDGRQYYLEYRQPIGFDAGMSGVLVNISGVADYFGPDGFLLTGIGDGGFLRAGDSYTDPQGLVTFTVVELLDTHAVIDVVFADGGAGEPTCEGGGAPEAVADVWGVLACAGGPFQGDAEPPVVAIASPTDGHRFDPGASFTIEVDASDDVMVSRVSLWLDGALQSTLTAPPWQWPVQDAPVGTFELYAVADDGIHETQSAIVTFEVREADAPEGESSGGGEGSGAPADSTDGAGDPSQDTDGDGALPPGFGGEDGADDGCGCRGPSTGSAAWGWIVALAGFASRRRRGGAERVLCPPKRAP